MPEPARLGAQIQRRLLTVEEPAEPHFAVEMEFFSRSTGVPLASAIYLAAAPDITISSAPPFVHTSLFFDERSPDFCRNPLPILTDFKKNLFAFGTKFCEGSYMLTNAQASI